MASPPATTWPSTKRIAGNAFTAAAPSATNRWQSPSRAGAAPTPPTSRFWNATTVIRSPTHQHKPECKHALDRRRTRRGHTSPPLSCWPDRAALQHPLKIGLGNCDYLIRRFPQLPCHSVRVLRGDQYSCARPRACLAATAKSRSPATSTTVPPVPRLPKSTMSNASSVSTPFCSSRVRNCQRWSNSSRNALCPSPRRYSPRLPVLGAPSASGALQHDRDEVPRRGPACGVQGLLLSCCSGMTWVKLAIVPEDPVQTLPSQFGRAQTTEPGHQLRCHRTHGVGVAVQSLGSFGAQVANINESGIGCGHER